MNTNKHSKTEKKDALRRELVMKGQTPKHSVMRFTSYSAFLRVAN